MKIKEMIKDLEKFEIHHQIISFLIILIATILITRGIVYYVIDPNPSIFGLELHHFDYGLILLIITSLLLLFGKKHFRLYLLFLGISLGLIIDQLWFIREQVGGNNPLIYNPSLTPVLILSIVIVLIALLISHLSKHK